MASHLYQKPIPEQLAAIAGHRRASMDHAVLLFCDAAAEPVLGSPFGT